MNENQITYAFFDIVNARKLLLTHDGLERFRKLWKDVELWTFHSDFGYLTLEKGNAREVPKIYIRAFSDSFLLYTKPEFIIDTFYKILEEFKKKIEEKNFEFYCIINRDNEVMQPDFPASGGIHPDNKYIPQYFQITGMGPAWVNIYLAEQFIKEHKEWHGKYNLYCIGDYSKASNYKIRDSQEINGYNGTKMTVIALN